MDDAASETGPTESGSERAGTLYRKGVLHAMRGEYRLASSRLQDALALDSDLTEALVELGKVLYAQKRIPEAIEAYRLALRQDPKLRSAHEGLALVYIGQRRFSDAVRQLGHIVRSNPRDVEAWLNLGDVAIYQGDEILAREHYRKAATLDPTATEVIAKARLRLAELERLAAEFAQVDNVQ
jgi:superkiller protein 3